MIENYELPLFPLHTVLFPGQMLPLHIFEPRYEQMMDDCLQGDRTLGVVLIQSGAEVGEAAIPHAVGTSATIQNVSRLPDGRRHIITRGSERFRLQNYWSTEKPYLMGRVASWPWHDSRHPGDELVQAVGRRLEQYVGLWSRANSVEIKLERIPQEPSRLAMLSAIALQISLKQKQALLEIPSVDELLQRLDDLLDDENRALQILLAAAQRRGEMDGAFSQN
jgi:Lon protease-like protein